VAQIVVGAFVSAAQAGLACMSIRECAEQSSAAGWDWYSLTPWREAAYAVGTPHAEGALAQLLHRLASLVVVPALAVLGAFAWRRGRRVEGAALLLLLLSVVALGLVSGSTGLPLVHWPV
jgi:heme A synthase